MALDQRHMAKLHIAKKELGLEDDEYRDALEANAGVRSAKDLDAAGFKRVMQYFESIGMPKSGAKPVRDPHELPTSWQLKKMQHLYTDLGWHDSTRQRGFNERQCGKPWPQTRREANKVIEGLKAMLRRKASVS